MSTLRLLTKRQLDKATKKLVVFELDNKRKKLAAIFKFAKHIDALVFIARITVHSEVHQHHPQITFTHNKVKVVLTTSELKGISKLDITLAKKIEKLKR